MKPLAILKRDLQFNKSLSSLIETLKVIAVSQYRILEQKVTTYENLIANVESFFQFIDTKIVDHPFVYPKKEQQAVIAITSDTGLLGGLNMNVIAAAMEELNKISGKLIVIGDRGKLYASEIGVPFVAFSGVSDEMRYGQAMQLRDYVVNEVLNESFGYVKVVYPRPVTFTVQTVETVSFLPFVPAGGKNPEVTRDIYKIIFESRPADIVEYVVNMWMGQKLYEAFGLSRLAEFAARYVHLEESTQKLKELDKKTQLQYFRARHEFIDRNMRELFSARLIFARS